MNLPSLRDYQERGIFLIRKAYSEGKRKILLFLATGGGKSVIFLHLIGSLLKNNKKVIFVVKRRQLVFQTQRHFEKAGIRSSILIANDKGFNPSLGFQICSIDTISRRDVSFLKGFDFCIVDEAHDATSPSYKTFFEKLESLGINNFIGLTASPFAVGSKSHSFWDACVKPIEMDELRDRGFLVPCSLFIPHKVNLDSIKIDYKNGDYQTKDLSNEMSRLEVVGNVIEDYKNIGQCRQAICFCVDKNHSKLMASEFMLHGIPAVHCDESTPQIERDQVIQRFKNGEIKVICNVNIFSTGVDIPEAEVGLMARPTRSEILWIQQVGRIFRPYRKCGKCHSQYDNSPKCPRCGYDKPSYIKERAIIIDSGDNVSRLGHPYDVRMPVMNEKDKNSNRSFSLMKTCKNCYYVYEKSISICPNCNFVPDKDEEESSVKSSDGSLVAYDEYSAIFSDFEKLKRTEIIKGLKPAWKYFKLYEKHGDKILKYNDKIGMPKWIPQIHKKNKLKEMEGKLYV